MPPYPHTYILFIGGLGGLVQWFVPYCGTICSICSGCSTCSACGEGIGGVVSDGFGGWVSTGSPPVGELPCFARFWSRGFAEEPTGYWSVGRPGDDWSIV